MQINAIPLNNVENVTMRSAKVITFQYLDATLK